MIKDIETYLASLSTFKKKKDFLKLCFQLEMKAKVSNILPGTFFINRQTFLRREVFLVSKLYLDNYAFTDEVKKYYETTQRFVLSLSSSLLKVYTLYRNSFLIYLKKGFYSDDFIRFARKINKDIEEVIEYPGRYSVYFATREERESFKKVEGNLAFINLKYKFFYDMCVLLAFNYEKINQMSVKIQKEMSYVLKMALHYANDISNSENVKRLEKLGEEHYIRLAPDNAQVLILKQLESLSTISSITSYLESRQIDPKKLFLAIQEYIIKYNSHLNKEDQLKLEKHLQEKINIYQREVLKKQEKENTMNRKNDSERRKDTFKKQAQDTILKFLAGDYYSKRAFCSEMGIDLCFFEKLVLSVKETSPALFLEYDKKRSLLDEKDPSTSLSLLKEIIFQIKHGVLLEDKVRAFDILDYFSQTTMTLQEALSLCKSSLGEEDCAVFSSFFWKNRVLQLITDNNIQSILKETIIFPIETNNDTNTISETTHVVTEEEKKEVLASLKDNNIPCYYSVYMLALKRKFSIYKQKKFK